MKKLVLNMILGIAAVATCSHVGQAADLQFSPVQGNVTSVSESTVDNTDSDIALTYSSTNLPNGYVGPAIQNVVLNFGEDLASAVYGEYYYNEDYYQIYTSCNVTLTDSRGRCNDPVGDPLNQSAPYLLNMNVNYLNPRQVQLRMLQNFTGNSLAKGSYTLTFKEGCITAKSGTKNKEFSITFSFDDPAPLVFSPGGETNIQVLDEIVIDCEHGFYVSGYFASMYNEKLETVQDSIFAKSYVFDKTINDYVEYKVGDSRIPNRAILKMKEPITTHGTYTLEIPSGMFFYASFDNVRATKLVYTIADPPAPISLVSSTPSTDVVSPRVSEIRLKFDKPLSSAKYGEFDEYSEDGMPIYTKVNVTLTDVNGNATDPNNPDAIYRTDINVHFFDDTQVRVMATDSASRALPVGKYNLKIAAGSIKAKDGSTNEEINLDFSLRDYYPMTITPENGAKVDKLSQIIIDNPDGICHTDHPADLVKDGMPIQYDLKGFSYVKNETTGAFDAYDTAFEGDAATPTRVIINLSEEVSAPGTYEIEFCEGFIFYMSSRDDYPAFKYSFVIEKTDGIESIEADEATATYYYNLQGIEVPADKLSSGIYLKATAGKAQKIVVK